MTDLKDKTVLITGASGGIGSATARIFAREGARLILTARRHDKMSELAEELSREYSTECHLITLDLKNQNSISARLGALPRDWKDIDVLVNNAGLARGVDKLYEMKSEDWNEVFDINVKALIAVTGAIVPNMVKRGVGHVINIGSIAGHEVYPGGAVYCSSKFAVNALSRGLKMDLLGTPIRVTSIDPGLVETEFGLVRFRGDEEKAKKPYQGLRPLASEDIAEAIVWSATRPAHVNIQEMIIFPTAQASTQLAHRE